MRLIVTGASSFVGAHLASRAVDRGHEVIALHNSTPVDLPGARSLSINLAKNASAGELRHLNADAVVHAAYRVISSSHRPPESLLETNRAMMSTILDLALPTLYLSSTCVSWHPPTAYSEGRIDDEQRLRMSGLPHAILRPSAPYGPPHPHHTPRHEESFHRLANLIVRHRLAPLPGRGTLRQPIHVDDLSDASLNLLESGLPNLTLPAGGPEALTMEEISRAIAHAAGGHCLAIPLPPALLAFAARFTEGLDPDLLRSAANEDLAPPEALSAASGVTPRPFSEGLVDLLRTIS